MRTYDMEYGEDDMRRKIYRTRNRIEEFMKNRDRSKFLINYLSFNFNFEI
jgi:hypothetical protein